MMGNFAIGTGALAPAGMMNSLVAWSGEPPYVVSHLISWGSVVLCIGAPVYAFLTNRWDRRGLLAGSLGLYVAGHAASAFAPDFAALLVLRLLMISSAAVFTAQAAGTVALFVAPERRATAIAFVFLGWSVATAFGLPLTGVLAQALGWRAVMGLLAAVSLAAAAGVWITLPGGLFVARLNAVAWGRVVTDRPILTILSVTAFSSAGQFTLFPYIAPELKRLADASEGEIALVLSLFGVAGVIGNRVVTSFVGRIGPGRANLYCLCFGFLGIGLWSLIGTGPVGAAICTTIWGLGFAASNAMQQARLGVVEPGLASASLSLNTSMIYLGQAAGTVLGGVLISAGANGALGFAGASIILGAIAASWTAQKLFRA